MIALPKHLILEVTSRCNYRCPFCYCVWHEFPELAGPLLSAAAWKKIIRHCVESGADDLLFSGGEALLRKDLPALIGLACELLPEGGVGVFTNGSRLNEEYLDFFRTRQVKVSISLPGLSTYGAMTGTRRSYRRTLEWIARAAELHCPMSVSLTATAANRHEFADMYSAASLSGAASIQMGAMMPEGCGRKHLDLTLKREEWETLKIQIRALPDSGVPYSFCDEMLCECRPQPEKLVRKFGNPSRTPCTAGTSFGVIGPSGKFRKCLHTTENMFDFNLATSETSRESGTIEKRDSRKMNRKDGKVS